MDDSRRLNQIRETLGFTQRQMADELKVTSGAIALWESGRRSIPGPVIRLIELYEYEFGIQHEIVPDGEAKFFIEIPDKNRKIRGLKLGSSLILTWISYSLNAVFSTIEKKNSLQKQAYISIAEKLFKELDQMKGLPMKLGQLFSERGDRGRRHH